MDSERKLASVMCIFLLAASFHRDNFFITQQFMSYMLGARRERVTAAAGSLKQRKLIRYDRGEVIILDRRGLESAANVCYTAAKAPYARIFG
jgi:CRP-like cAMP-binding protein